MVPYWKEWINLHDGTLNKTELTSHPTNTSLYTLR